MVQENEVLKFCGFIAKAIPRGTFIAFNACITRRTGNQYCNSPSLEIRQEQQTKFKENKLKEKIKEKKSIIQKISIQYKDWKEAENVFFLEFFFYQTNGLIN